MTTCTIPTRTITVEIGRERDYTIELEHKLLCSDPCVDIPPDSVERAVMRIGDIVLDTDALGSPLTFNEEKTALLCKFGMIEGWVPYEIYSGHITIYDADAHIGGLPWARILIKTLPWPAEAEPEP